MIFVTFCSNLFPCFTTCPDSGKIVSVRGKNHYTEGHKGHEDNPLDVKADGWNNLSIGTAVEWFSKMVTLCDLCTADINRWPFASKALSS